MIRFISKVRREFSWSISWNFLVSIEFHIVQNRHGIPMLYSDVRYTDNHTRTKLNDPDSAKRILQYLKTSVFTILSTPSPTCPSDMDNYADPYKAVVSQTFRTYGRTSKLTNKRRLLQWAPTCRHDDSINDQNLRIRFGRPNGAIAPSLGTRSIRHMIYLNFFTQARIAILFLSSTPVTVPSSIVVANGDHWLTASKFRNFGPSFGKLVWKHMTYRYGRKRCPPFSEPRLGPAVFQLTDPDFMLPSAV